METELRLNSKNICLRYEYTRKTQTSVLVYLKPGKKNMAEELYSKTLHCLVNNVDTHVCVMRRHLFHGYDKLARIGEIREKEVIVKWMFPFGKLSR